jgi:hypothetical protein
MRLRGQGYSPPVRKNILNNPATNARTAPMTKPDFEMGGVGGRNFVLLFTMYHTQFWSRVSIGDLSVQCRI